jgi:hypothetical protein
MKIQKISAFILAVAVSGILPIGVAIADQVSNNLDNTVDATLEVATITAGGSVSVGFYVQVSKNDPKGDVDGCNATGNNPATLTFINLPSGVTVSPSSVTFTGCGTSNVQYVSFSSSIPGTYTIDSDNFSMSGGKTGSLWNLDPAAFTLQVNTPAPSDDTPPVITPTVDPEPNAAGWNNTDVTVTWSVVDPESPITSTSGCETVTLTEETAGTVLTCTATSEGGTASSSVTIKIDKTKPVITGSRFPLPNENGWNNTDVEVSFVCEDTGDVQSGIATNTVAGTTLSDEGAGQWVTNTGSCVDVAGNVADPVTVSGINIDKTAPEVTIVTPEDDGSYTFKQMILAEWSVFDGLSGIDTATGTVPSGDPIDTSSLGAKSFTVTATDLAGNSTTVTVNYEVVSYTFGGFGAPLTISLKDFKKMSTIPVKFQLFDTDGNPVSNAIATLEVCKPDLSCMNAASSGGSNVDNYFRYDPVKQQYIFNLSTKTLSLGSNELKVTLDDGTEYSQTITIK